ncbi:MAG: 4Fe-4S binding protein [Acholeplasmataceae bacterium]|jgi:2-oxoglutarate ferredoxin oxidoreductase subunit delta|nr:4Fe-4S binding protein [Acholeplasmataceae bacterium]
MARGKLNFKYEDCKGCSLCVEFCPTKILELDRERMNDKGYNLVTVKEPEKCIACAICAMMCPDSVITVMREQ